MSAGAMCDVKNSQFLLLLNPPYRLSWHWCFIFENFLAKYFWTCILSTYPPYKSSFVCCNSFFFLSFSNYKLSTDLTLALYYLLSYARLTEMCRTAFRSPFLSVGVFSTYCHHTRPNIWNVDRLLIHNKHFKAVF